MREGAGIAVLPDYILASDLSEGRLLRLLAGWTLPQGGVPAVYPTARHTSAKVRAFADYLREHLESQNKNQGPRFFP